MHESIDLKLGLVENVRGWFLDVIIYNITNAGVQAHLFESSKSLMRSYG